MLTDPAEAAVVERMNLARLSEDWQAKYGHPVVLVESFVDLEWFRGTACKASDWKAIGTTAGFQRVAQDFYEAQDRRKQLFVRECSVPQSGAGIGLSASALGVAEGPVRCGRRGRGGAGRKGVAG